MASVKADVWSSVLEDIQQAVGEQRTALWFKNIRPVSTEGDCLTLGVPNLFVQEWVETHFADVLRQAVERHAGPGATVRFVIDPQMFRQARATQLKADAEIVAAAAEPTPSAQTKDETPHLRPDFTMDRFVVGPGNKLAHACAMEIVESSSNRFHPLFIHSLSGLGKTHLMQAILHEIRRRNDGRTVEYVSAEAFTNQFFYAMRSNRLDAFRNRYRNTDVLLIDDIHFFSNKGALQDELLHTYDAIDTGRKQLVLASDVHPKMLAKIKQALLNRFAAGMVVRMTQPDFSTRVTILKAKLQQQSRRLPDEVLRYVARGFEGSVRELTGAATMILAYASLTGEKIDVTLARKALARLEQPSAGTTGIGAVEAVVARQYGVKPEALRAKKQSKSTRLARQVCIYLARQCTTMSCREIARHFGSINHSTVVFTVSRIEESMKGDKNLAELLAAMTEQVRKA